jgi:hypothetical protein
MMGVDEMMIMVYEILFTLAVRKINPNPKKVNTILRCDGASSCVTRQKVIEYIENKFVYSMRQFHFILREYSKK